MHSLTFAFLKREVNILINYTNIFKKKQIKNFLEIHSSNWFSVAEGIFQKNYPQKISKYRPPDGRFYPPYTIVFSCTSKCGMMVNKSWKRMCTDSTQGNSRIVSAKTHDLTRSLQIKKLLSSSKLNKSRYYMIFSNLCFSLATFGFVEYPRCRITANST